MLLKMVSIAIAQPHRQLFSCPMAAVALHSDTWFPVSTEPSQGTALLMRKPW